MKYPSSLSSPAANLISFPEMPDGNLDGSRIGIRVWGWICSSAGLKTGAGPFACPIAEFDPISVTSNKTSTITGALFMTRCAADSRCGGINHILGLARCDRARHNRDPPDPVARIAKLLCPKRVYEPAFLPVLPYLAKRRMCKLLSTRTPQLNESLFLRHR